MPGSLRQSTGKSTNFIFFSTHFLSLIQFLVFKVSHNAEMFIAKPFYTRCLHDDFADGFVYTSIPGADVRNTK